MLEPAFVEHKDSRLLQVFIILILLPITWPQVKFLRRDTYNNCQMIRHSLKGKTTTLSAGAWALFIQVFDLYGFIHFLKQNPGI